MMYEANIYACSRLHGPVKDLLPSQFCCLQDPSYPVYVDSSVIMGMTGEYDEGSKGFGKLQYMVCRPENDFFPDLSKVANCCRCTSKGLNKSAETESRQACVALLAQHWHMTAAGEEAQCILASLLVPWGLHPAGGPAWR